MCADPVEVRPGGGCVPASGLTQIAQLRNLGQHAANVVVHILGDAQPLFLHRMLGFQDGQFPLVLSPLQKSQRAGKRPDQ